jgi:hypothetical protein
MKHNETRPEGTWVSVLTAEVHTLMVGSRQVTMSVWNQLDQVRDELIKPMGRVRPKDEADPTPENPDGESWSCVICGDNGQDEGRLLAPTGGPSDCPQQRGLART